MRDTSFDVISRVYSERGRLEATLSTTSDLEKWELTYEE